jgi:hypothetical protein
VAATKKATKTGALNRAADGPKALPLRFEFSTNALFGTEAKAL